MAVLMHGDDAEAVKLLNAIKVTAADKAVSVEWTGPGRAVWAHLQKAMCRKRVAAPQAILASAEGAEVPVPPLLGREDRLTDMLHCSAEPPTSDEELACRAQRGCAESFERLMRRFQTPVLQFLRRRGFAAESEDLAQETFLRAYENLSRYSRRWAFSAWLFTIARRTSLNSRRRTRPTADLAAVNAATSGDPEPLDILVAEEGRRRLWDLAAEILSGNESTALWLYYVEDVPVRGIALVLGRSRGFGQDHAVPSPQEAAAVC